MQILLQCSFPDPWEQSLRHGPLTVNRRIRPIPGRRGAAFGHSRSVTAPSEAVRTVRAYFASTPRV